MYSTVTVLTVLCCSAYGAFTVNVYDDVAQEPVTSEAVSSCDNQACDQLCRRLGFPGGACVDNNCKCFNMNKIQDTLVQGLRSCDMLECEQRCRRIGFPGGACVNGRCKCDIIQSDDDNEISVNGEADIVGEINNDLDVLRNKQTPDTLVQGLHSCDMLECEQRCRRIGFPGGACVNGRCKCDIIQSDDDNEISVNGEADIVGEINNDLDVLRNKQIPVSEIMLRSSAVRLSCDCVPRNCDMYCFRIHYTGGICVTGSCRCYK